MILTYESPKGPLKDFKEKNLYITRLLFLLRFTFLQLATRVCSAAAIFKQGYNHTVGRNVVVIAKTYNQIHRDFDHHVQKHCEFI